MSKETRWYSANAGNDSQGLVIEETTGRNVAVTYDKADAPLVAAAPELLQALELFLPLATNSKCIHSVKWTTARDTARAALAKAKEAV